MTKPNTNKKTREEIETEGRRLYQILQLDTSKNTPIDEPIKESKKKEKDEKQK